MSDTLNVAIIQTDVAWEQADENLGNLTRKIKSLPEHTDLVVLAEMFPTGFSMFPAEISETMNGNTVKWMLELSATTKTAITGSVVIEENGKYYNRLLFVTPDGSIEQYDKRHTFTLSGEDKVYERGYEKKIFNFRGWKICPMVCYDLRFPVWSRNVEDYDLLIYTANWPIQRIDAWDALLKARAIENMSYCIGVNRVGSDGNGYEFNGHSAVYDGLGECILSFEEGEDAVGLVSMGKKHLNDIRTKLKFLADRDDFNLVV